MTSHSDPTPNLRLQRLRVAVKLMLLLAFLVVIYVSVSSFSPTFTTKPEMPELLVDLERIAPGTATTVIWNDRPVIIVSRTAQEIQFLAKNMSQLEDASSSHSEQPEFAQVPHRSRDPQWFVAIALGTDFSCLVDRVSSVPGGEEGQAGLQDACRGSYYDLAGRVIRGQYADRNLAIPEYRISGSELRLGAR